MKWGSISQFHADWNCNLVFEIWTEYLQNQPSEQNQKESLQSQKVQKNTILSSNLFLTKNAKRKRKMPQCSQQHQKYKSLSRKSKFCQKNQNKRKSAFFENLRIKIRIFLKGQGSKFMFVFFNLLWKEHIAWYIYFWIIVCIWDAPKEAENPSKRSQID